MKTIMKDKIRGSLIGGAIGDALGYPVEFMSYAGIVQKYGDKGITRYELDRNNGKALISDDTQMSLFTTNGLLFAITRVMNHGALGADLHDYVRNAYTEWYETQTGVRDYYNYHTCWIRDIKQLNVRRAPGNTCMSALQSIVNGNEVLNDSKGCGGIMRVAPVGCFMANQNNEFDWNEHSVNKYAAECAAITHKHPLGYIPAAVLANIVFRVLSAKEPVSKGSLIQIVESALADARADFTKEKEVKAWSELRTLMNNAMRLSNSDIPDAEAIKQLGEGWTGDEALVIAVYCSLKYSDCFEDAIVAAVNHNGDSDSTGAICGNIMGAVVGYEAIPTYYVENLEMRELIVDLSDDLTEGCQINEYKHASTPSELLWEQRYIFINPECSVAGIKKPHYMLTLKAEHCCKCKRIIEYINNAQDEQNQCRLFYDLARIVFDTPDFTPQERLKYASMPYGEPQECPSSQNRPKMPAYCWYFDVKYSPFSRKVFKLNASCFEGKQPIIAVRDDCGMHRDGFNYSYEIISGLEPYTDSSLAVKYPDWLFMKIIPSRVDEEGFAVFANRLEKEFAVEIAHLDDDGALHRIYHVCY